MPSLVFAGIFMIHLDFPRDPVKRLRKALTHRAPETGARRSSTPRFWDPAPAGAGVACEDTYESMAFSRGASALGVALAWRRSNPASTTQPSLKTGRCGPDGPAPRRAWSSCATTRWCWAAVTPGATTWPSPTASSVTPSTSSRFAPCCGRDKKGAPRGTLGQGDGARLTRTGGGCPPRRWSRHRPPLRRRSSLRGSVQIYDLTLRYH